MKNWLTNRAKKIEKRCLYNFGKSLSFTGIEGILGNKAILEHQSDKGTMIIDIDKFKENERKYLTELGLK